MENEYCKLHGMNLLMSLTENGTKPIDKEVVAALSNEEIEAMIVAVSAANEELSINSQDDLQEEKRWVSDTGRTIPPCFYYWDLMGSELCAYGGNFSVIVKGQCDGCSNYGAMVGLEKEIPEL